MLLEVIKMNSGINCLDFSGHYKLKKDAFSKIEDMRSHAGAWERGQNKE